MKYNVSINEAKRSITVTLANGVKGVARCCPTDRFDINTGIELALERARVASNAKASKKTTVRELIEALEKALPEGEMVVVGNGDKMTEAQKKWLISLAGGNQCNCNKATKKELYYEAFEEGYNEGYADAMEEIAEEESEAEELEEALEHIRDILADIGITI